MPLFGRRRRTSWTGPGPGVSGIVMPPGWRAVPGRPFDGRLEDSVHEATRVMYGMPRYQTSQRVVGNTTFADVFRASIGGRAVTVANSRTFIEPGLFPGGQGTPSAAVCAVELPSMLPFTWIQPRRYPRRGLLAGSGIGAPAFDDAYEVHGTPEPLAAVTGLSTLQEALTPDVQRRILARDDWIFCAERYLLGCFSKGTFGSAEEIDARVGEVLGIVAAFPASVLPAHVDHSPDDLVARFNRVDSVEDAVAMLQELTPRDRETLARSDTPLAAFADVQTPEEAMARFQSLDPRLRMQIVAMFMRAGDD
jgi:hypothetical protein